MNHHDRLRLIHRPFLITRFTTSYPWGGANTGGYIIPDYSGGRQRGPCSTSHIGIERSGPQWAYNDDPVTLWDAQHLITIGDDLDDFDPDDPE